MITPKQLLFVMLLSRLSAEVIYPQGGGFSGNSLAALAAAEVIRFLLALPVILYSARGRSFYGAAAAKSRALGVVAAYLSAFVVSYLAARTALYAAEYAQRTLVVGMSAAVLGVLMAVFAVYAASKGIEAIGRTVLLLAVAAVVVSGAVVLGDISHIEFRRISAAEYGSDLLQLTAERLLRGGEYFVLAALLPYVRCPERGIGACSAALIYAGGSLVLTMLINLFAMSVLGEVYGIAEHPFTAAAGLADVTLFKRLDGFCAGVWCACAALRCGLLLFSGYAAIKAVLGARESSPRKGEAA